MNKRKTELMAYRPCVGVVVINKEGLVWAGHRIAEEKGELSPSDFRWQLPQGGIDKGEEPIDAARRELYEETGIRSISLLAEAPEWIKYDLPDHLMGVALKGKYRGQTQRWFAFRFEGDESEIAINPPPDGYKAEFDTWQWRRLSDLPGLIVPFKRGVYEEVLAAFSHLTV
ncbi:RNA pyrophosphohydrolase [Hoeflea prorocentri]|uniref:RNA pyrophosphohydrolase n=1 Tax=Hoeflea prorocentri TaxID=1922333 RepID=A0A9X3UQP1_9HYPH|nr:RNA pyrophosphohydrolase [Hoeflea prorocentri]MCY6383451.1 RNA pyrophosphohydrolase [Hoeflea prorocentri]MDA5401251.1 RNA pyrophosphohydrolase [Hoeflea prorocentri]